MKGQFSIQHFEAKKDGNGNQITFQSGGGLLYVFLVSVYQGSTLYMGEANTKTPNTWWQKDTPYTMEIIGDPKRSGGNLIKISKPMQNNGGQQNAPASPVQAPGSPQPPQQSFQSGSSRGSSIASQPQTESYSRINPNQHYPNKEYLIASEAAFKAAIEYIGHFTDEERKSLYAAFDVNKDKEPLTALAGKIYQGMIKLSLARPDLENITGAPSQLEDNTVSE